jgi:hypothetical protein
MQVGAVSDALALEVRYVGAHKCLLVMVFWRASLPPILGQASAKSR